MIDINNFDNIMKFISVGIGIRPVGSCGLACTRDYIAKKFDDFGIGWSYQNFTYENKPLDNVVGVIPAKVEAKKILCFVAHYDSVPVGRGCMDNASGVATILELARSFKGQVEKDFVELRFIALAGEEVGCVGSMAYLNSLSKEEKEKFICCYNFDMFMARKTDNATLVVNTQGGLEKGEYVVGSDEVPFDNIISKEIMGAFSQSDIEENSLLKNIWCPRNYGHSDHESFHNEKIPSANVTIRGDKAHNGQLPFGYHTMEDSYDSEAFNYDLTLSALKIVSLSVINMLKNY